MNAAEVINLFVEASGRYDLLTTEETDDEPPVEVEVPSTRAYHYLNSAQRWLDRELAYPKEDAWLIKTVPANETLITFNQARFVKDVFEGTTRVEWQRAYYDSEYEPEEDESDSHWPLQAIEVVASEQERTLKILAAWYSPQMTDGTDVSFWTVQHPDLLVRAMMMQCEVDMRNSQGVNDYAQPLTHDCQQIYKDLIAEQMAGPSDYWRMS